GAACRTCETRLKRWSVEPTGVLATMSYYLVLNFDVHDPAEFAEYGRRAAATLPASAKVLVFDSEPRDLEGRSRERLVILEFESEAAALGWYHSSEYQAASERRRAATDGWVRAAPGFSVKRA